MKTRKVLFVLNPCIKVVKVTGAKSVSQLSSTLSSSTAICLTINHHNHRGDALDRMVKKSIVEKEIF